MTDLKEKLQIITQKFANCRKERDQLKQENKELQEENMQLSSSIRQMVPCFSNTSTAFPMMNEMQQIASEFYKVDCQDVFFDVLSLELNLEGVVYFYQNIIGSISETVIKHFAPVETILKKVSQQDLLDGPVSSILKKTYQSKWQKIASSCLSEHYHEKVMKKVQQTLCIADGVDNSINTQI